MGIEWGLMGIDGDWGGWKGGVRGIDGDGMGIGGGWMGSELVIAACRE